MFDSKLFFDALHNVKMSVPQLAEKLGISKVTLYRKISGESDFVRSEIQQCMEIFGKETAASIFFADEVA